MSYRGRERVKVQFVGKSAFWLNRRISTLPYNEVFGPAAHNGLVAGSSPAGPTKNISILLSLRCS